MQGAAGTHSTPRILNRRPKLATALSTTPHHRESHLFIVRPKDMQLASALGDSMEAPGTDRMDRMGQAHLCMTEL